MGASAGFHNDDTWRLAGKEGVHFGSGQLFSIYNTPISASAVNMKNALSQIYADYGRFC